MPPRSRLYPLAPIEAGTPFIESLTSYINRLARAYRINPRQLVAQEIIPSLGGSYRLSLRQLGPFVRFEAMNINGTGNVAIDWTTTLERLTLRSDLLYLNIRLWASELPMRGLMRATPAWCPQCYQEWLKDYLPVYQPLLWMLQVVTICQKHQTVIASSTLPIDHCTRCGTWLGTPSSVVADSEIDQDTIDWQKWVMGIIEELREASTTSGLLPWGDLRYGLAACRKILGGSKQLCQLVDVPDISLTRWITGKVMPSLENLLKLCYVLDLSPLQLMTNSSSTLEEALMAKSASRLPRPRIPTHLPQEQEEANNLEFIQAVLEGREAPHSVRQIERRFGLGKCILRSRYPHESPLVTAQYRAYRNEQARKRMEKINDEVRTATFSLHAQGIFPSQVRVSSMLTDPNWMIMPETRAALHAARHELGQEL